MWPFSCKSGVYELVRANHAVHGVASGQFHLVLLNETGNASSACSTSENYPYYYICTRQHSQSVKGILAPAKAGKQVPGRGVKIISPILPCFHVCTQSEHC